jgi:HPt (histidine-containing phosphotransfer) domain-containing protein
VEESSQTAEIGLVDWNAALQSVQGDQELMLVVIEAVFEECPRLMEDLEQAIAKGDYPAVQRGAHTIKGSFRHFGTSRVEALAERLEEMGRAKSLDNAMSTLTALRIQMEKVLRELFSYSRTLKTRADDSKSLL